eukprot:770235-Pleurochrysis_carterae.AAC.1
MMNTPRATRVITEAKLAHFVFSASRSEYELEPRVKCNIDHLDITRKLALRAIGQGLQGRNRDQIGLFRWHGGGGGGGGARRPCWRSPSQGHF